jgi:Holliday junction DNA helicase RuvA
MIRTLRGAFHPQADGTAVIETVAGIGFLVNLPANSTLYKKYEGEEVTAYTLMIVKEDDMSLYGFENRDELALFKLLISVNGVGPKAGMAIMSILPEQELRRAIGTGDAKTIAQANGVGKKTAERVILELKDKVGEFADAEGYELPGSVPVPSNDRIEAINALMGLGYGKSEAETAVGKVKDEGLSVEDYIRRALKEF